MNASVTQIEQLQGKFAKTCATTRFFLISNGNKPFQNTFFKMRFIRIKRILFLEVFFYPFIHITHLSHSQPGRQKIKKHVKTP
jgi:hypothetical protein